jgi:hypothetical protein
MAERDIVGGMFGVTPEMYQRSIAARDTATNAQIAGLTPGQLSGFYAMEAGTGLGRATQGLLGVEDPQLSLIRQTNQLVQQIGVDTPEKLQTLAAELQKIPGGGQLAMQAIDKSNQMMKTGSEAQIAQQKITQEKLLREELAKLGDNPTDEAYLSVFRKFGTPDQQARAIEASINRKAKLASMEGSTGPGPVGKAGAFRDVDGNILGATEMKNVRAEFTEGQKLLKLLNDATAKDIKDAESYVDWTTAGITKGLASSKTLNAQTKLAAAQLVEQISNLPPGSASDADMRASMKSFPGYSDPESLRQWVNRTKAKLQSRMEDISGQFGFQQRTVSSGDIMFDKPSSKKPAPAPTATQDEDSLVNKYLNPKK